MYIHFVGIGGIGMSALARYYHTRGHTVSGSDVTPSEITAQLVLQGIQVRTGPHRRNNLPVGVDLVIHTAAVPATNPELALARARRRKIRSYAQAVAELTRQYKTIAIAGAHGKSTTTALAALVLEEGYLDPTVIIGTKLREFGDSNFRSGKSPYLVLEADEYNRSFLHYHPFIAVVTNLDAEHLDTYRNLADIQRAFQRFLARVPQDGAIIVNDDNEQLGAVMTKIHHPRILRYSLADREAALVRRVLRIPGEHNVANALAALKLGRLLGISEPDILRSLARFEGAWRRFEFKGLLKGAVLYTDYAHHPTEIKATLAAARERFPLRRLWCMYQPHQYQRLAYLWEDFTRAFDLADVVCLLHVYEVAGRETQRARTAVNSEKLAQELTTAGKQTYYRGSLEEAKTLLEEQVRPGDVVFLMGAGDIYTLPQIPTLAALGGR